MKNPIPTIIGALMVLVVIIAIVGVAKADWIEHNTAPQTASANSCKIDCRYSHEDDYDQCMADCEADNQASTQPNTMLADGGCYQQDDGSVICYGEDGSVVQQSNAAMTQFASLRVDPDPLCDTDAFGCFSVPNKDTTLSNDARILNTHSEETQQAFFPIIIYCILQCTTSK